MIENSKVCNFAYDDADRPIETAEGVELLGITINSNLQFQSHVEAICKKIKAFSHIAGFLQKPKAYVLYKALIKSTLNYYPVI